MLPYNLTARSFLLNYQTSVMEKARVSDAKVILMFFFSINNIIKYNESLIYRRLTEQTLQYLKKKQNS